MSIAPSFQSTFLGQKPTKNKVKKAKKTSKVDVKNGNKQRRKKTT
jgi:hypothetical protein